MQTTSGSAMAKAAASSPERSQREQRAFKRSAARLNLRLCPSCNAPVQKTCGCNRMSCRCGARFEWSSAKPVVKTYRYRTYRYGKQAAGAVGTAAVVVVAAPVVVAGAAVALAGVAVLIYGLINVPMIIV